MSLALVAALALSTAPPVARCSWDHPGANAFVGPVPAAVDRYTDIPVEVRERLKARMERRDFDEMATIRRDSITGRYRYASEIRDMHFGTGRVCRTVTRSQWAPEAVERGLVYCEAEHCIIVPTVCRNVSRVTRLPGPGEEAQAQGMDVLPGLFADGPPGAGVPDGRAGPLAAAEAGPGDGVLVFDPPGAGEAVAGLPDPLGPGAGPLGAPGAGGVPVAGPVLEGLPGGTGLPEGGPGAAPPPGGVPLGAPPLGGGSGLDVPPGVLPVGGGSVGVGGIPPIPEPSAWLLGLSGLGAVLLLVRRRRPG
jgi:hypothetical protein